MTIIPITYWTAKSDLIRLGQQPALLQNKMYIGLPFKMKDDANVLSQSYVILPLKHFFNPHLKREAARLHSIVTRTVLGNRNRNTGWLQVMALPEIRHLRQNSALSMAWTYMIIDTVIRERPLAYLNGQQHLADFFAERWQLDYGKDQNPPLTREVFHRHLLSRAYLEASLNLKMELAFRQEKIIGQMEGLEILTETYMQVMIVLMGLLSGVTGVIVIDVILEGFIGYMNFLNDLENAEADGIITEEEAFGMWFSLVGVFLPFARGMEPGAIKSLIDRAQAGLGIVGLAAILLQMTIGLLRGVSALIESTAASAAGFSEYMQYDPENTIVIQL